MKELYLIWVALCNWASMLSAEITNFIVKRITMCNRKQIWYSRKDRRYFIIDIVTLFDQHHLPFERRWFPIWVSWFYQVDKRVNQLVPKLSFNNHHQSTFYISISSTDFHSFWSFLFTSKYYRRWKSIRWLRLESFSAYLQFVMLQLMMNYNQWHLLNLLVWNEIFKNK